MSLGNAAKLQNARQLILALFVYVFTRVTSAQSPTPDSLDPSPTGGYGVYCTALQPDGKILVGGNFTALAGQTCNNLGRLSTDGTLDPIFSAAAGGPVYSLALQTDGKILVGGSFTNLSGQTRYYIGRLNADGTLDMNFNPGASYYVFSLALQPDGKIVVGGSFNTLAGETHRFVGRIQADGMIDPTFNPTIPGSPAGTPWVSCVAIQPDGKILVAGEFAALDSASLTNIGRLNADGTLDNTFAAQAGGSNPHVFAVLVQADGKVLVGGIFNTLNSQACSCIGRLNADGTLDASFDPGANSYVSSLALQTDGKILVGGSFTNLGGQSRNYVGRLNADGTLDMTFNPNQRVVVECSRWLCNRMGRSLSADHSQRLAVRTVITLPG
jgi:uncharacterized delta-60 repeat protein